ncbi:glycosyl transferase family protein [Candidatus Magnetobacterium bavaricum]|uniref:Glycosyl transferase family protein n=1 Tax=Candidatus Magnetobacterium bavaricum TaxID=29290 RepID=A0A0F3GTQ5_9BACT|nr:glycosyl transferase family protein [Candidatus Magnetobacterium bavaricum]
MNIGHNILPVFLLSFQVSIVCSFLISIYGHKMSLIDSSNERKSHYKPTPRGGGIGIWIAYTGIGLFVLKNHSYVLITSSIGLLGLMEDFFNLSSKLRLTVQILLTMLLLYLHNKITVSPEGIVFFILWVLFIVGTTNFYNFMDGINGIAGLTSLVSFGLTGYFSYYILNEPVIALMCISIVAACLAFLPLNIPNAKVFMGDTGSLFLGFVFASFVLKLSLNINIFFCLIMFLCLFYADALLTIFYRWKKREHLMQAHRKHLYQYLANELKIPHWIVSTIYSGVNLFFGLVALFTYTKGFVWQITMLITFSLMFIVCYKQIKTQHHHLT